MARTSFAKLCGIGSIALAGIAAGIAWADKSVAVGPLVQVSGASPLPPFSACGNFPGGFPFGSGINYLDTEVGPWVEANPTDSKNIVAFYQQDRWSNGGSRANVAAVSLDGGATWETVIVPGLSQCTAGQYERASNPWLSFSPNGALHQMSELFNIDPPPSAPGGFGPSAMAVSRSLDGGLTWSGPILIQSDTDPRFLNTKNSITADPKNPNLVYAVWTRLDADPVVGFPFKGPAYFARTTDGGVSWEPAREMFDPGLNNEVLGSQIVVLPNGTLLNFFDKVINVNPDGTFNSDPLRLTVIRSDDKGSNWDTTGGGTEIAVIRSSLVQVTPDLQIFMRTGSVLFDVAVDPRNGNLYAVWQDSRFTGVDEVAFSQSKDRGHTWSSPIKVNQTPPNPLRPLTQQAFLPSVAVGGNGTVVVTHYDFRNDGDTGELADYWMVSCKSNCDEPAKWGEIRLTEASFDYQQAPVVRGLFLGDYLGLAATREGYLAFFQQSSVADRASGFFRKVTK
jgi:hypothetical protein